MEQIDEIMKEFLVECYENLDQLDSDLLELEDVPDDRERLASIFRTIHTIKGTSGFLALPRLEKLTHVGESLLVPLRDGELRLNNEIADGLLKMVDAVRTLLRMIESTGGEGDEDYSDLLVQLERLQKSGDDEDAAGGEEDAGNQVDSGEAETDASDAAESTAESQTPEVAVAAESESESTTKEQDSTTESEAGSEATAAAPETTSVAEPAAVAQPEATAEPAAKAEPEPTAAAKPAAAAEPAVAAEPAAAATPTAAATPAASEAPSSDPPKSEAAASEPSAELAKKEPAKSPAPKSEPPKPAKQRMPVKKEAPAASQTSIADTTLRIDVQILDKLMNLVGELVLSRNQVLQFSDAAGGTALNNAMQKLNLVTSELQEAVMKTRMQPIRNAWSKLPRVVRDLANSCGKKVQVVMEGADTELDKTVLEAIKDPLTHIVRNSVDHGINTPDQRALNGKPEMGTLWLRAFHEGGLVNIEVADDGRGLDLERIKAKAIENGIVTQEQADLMGDREVIGLVLLPGFSTAAAVTNVSGRGVGMDVVKTNIERIGGTLDIQTEPGLGTTLRIKLPLTLAIVPALVVKSASHSFAIPQVNLLELLRLEGERASQQIEFVYGAPVYRLRGNLLPLLYLDELLDLDRSQEVTVEPELDENGELKEEPKKTLNIVVLQAEDRQFGLVVDAITDTQEIVVKPLGQHLQSISAYAGATIMGDGTVALILDVIGLAHKGMTLSEHRDLSVLDNNSGLGDLGADYKSLLIVDLDDGTRAAIQLSTIARLEEFDADKVERCGQSQVIQYRDEILPLVSLGSGFGMRDVAAREGGQLHVVVYSVGDQTIGLVVDKIVDIVQQKITGQPGEENTSRIINDHVTEIIDLDQLARQCLDRIAC